MFRIVYRWDDEKGTLWTLAIIERGPASRALLGKIEQQDEAIKNFRAQSCKQRYLLFLRRQQKQGTQIQPAPPDNSRFLK